MVISLIDKPIKCSRKEIVYITNNHKWELLKKTIKVAAYLHLAGNLSVSYFLTAQCNLFLCSLVFLKIFNLSDFNLLKNNFFFCLQTHKINDFLLL